MVLLDLSDMLNVTSKVSSCLLLKFDSDLINSLKLLSIFQSNIYLVSSDFLSHKIYSKSFLKFTSKICAVDLIFLTFIEQSSEIIF